MRSPRQRRYLAGTSGKASSGQACWSAADLSSRSWACASAASSGGSAWDWHLVEPELRERGHDSVAVDLPNEDASAGWPDYVDAVVGALGSRTGVIVVGHSLGGFTAPLVADRIPVDLLVFVAGMVPAPGELFADWWTNTGYEPS